MSESDLISNKKKTYHIPHRSRISDEKKVFVKNLRRNQTYSQRKVWNELRGKKLGFKFRRQAIIFGWVADFYCPEKMLIIEIDEEHHNTQEQKELDFKRDKFLKEKGFITIRFTNLQVFETLPEVIQRIKEKL